MSDESLDVGMRHGPYLECVMAVNDLAAWSPWPMLISIFTHRR